uniref:Orcokinin n=1 Tax=Parastrongyloides trichosuri TaxID=131310 RepID=A0A0N4ZR14_PARTI
MKKSPLDFAAISSQLGSTERMRYGKRNIFDVSMLPHVIKLNEVGKRSNNEEERDTNLKNDNINSNNFDKRSITPYLEDIVKFEGAGKRSDFIGDLKEFNDIGKRSGINKNSNYLNDIGAFNELGKRSTSLDTSLLHQYNNLGKRFNGDVREITHFYNLGKRSMLHDLEEFDKVGKRSSEYITDIAEFEKLGKRSLPFLNEIGKFQDVGKRSPYNNVIPIYDSVGKKSLNSFGDSGFYYDSMSKRLSSILKNVAEYNEIGKRSNGLVDNLAHYQDVGKRSNEFDNLNYYYQHGKRAPSLNAIINNLNGADRLR